MKLPGLIFHLRLGITAQPGARLPRRGRGAAPAAPPKGPSALRHPVIPGTISPHACTATRSLPSARTAFLQTLSLARRLFYMGGEGKKKPKPARNRLAGNYISQHLLLATVCFIIPVLKIGIR